MNSNLEKFLELPELSDVTGTVTLPRIGATITVRAMSEPEFRTYQKRVQGKIKRNPMKNNYDAGAFMNMVVSNHIIDPDFSNSEFLSKTGCSDSDDFISRKLLSGEITAIYAKINEISGFHIELDEDIEEAKN